MFHYHGHFQKINHKISLLIYHFVTSLLKEKFARFCNRNENGNYPDRLFSALSHPNL